MEDVERLRGILVAALVVVVGLGFYLMWCFFRFLTLLPSVQRVKKQPRTWVQEIHLLDIINKAHEDCGWHYCRVTTEPKGEVILAWREWEEASGKFDKTLDVLFVKEDGSVETLGTCVEYEVFGPPQEM